MEQEQITLRCEDGQEAVVFTKYNFNGIIQELTNGHLMYKDSFEIMVEDSYVGGDYKGFFGRIKRAWRAFWDKPVVYTGVYCEDKDKMRKFLCDCLKVIDGVYRTPAYIVTLDESDNEPFLNGLYAEDGSVTSNEELIKKGEW